MAATAMPRVATAGQAAGGDMLTPWAEATRRRRAAGHGLGGLRFAFYGRVSAEDWQNPVTSRARQRDRAAALVAGHGRGRPPRLRPGPGDHSACPNCGDYGVLTCPRSERTKKPIWSSAPDKRFRTYSNALPGPQ
jgi:hypothetical protein